MIKKYLTHDNGCCPFRVVIDESKIDIFKTNNENENDEKSDKLLYTFTDFNKVFIGNDPENDKNLGNSLLVQIKDNLYMFIGDNIHNFKIDADDEIISFVSPIGNSDVAYPYATSNKNTYLISYNKYIPNDKININEDPYSQDNINNTIDYNIDIITERLVNNSTKTRYFKLVNEETNESFGRYTGETPKQAASKAFTKLIQINNHKGIEIPETTTLTLKESTRGCSKKVYKFMASRLTLDPPQKLIIRNDIGEEKTITYNYRNKVKKI